MSGVVLVTGAAGGIGRALVPALRERGWRVRCLRHRRPIADADEVVAGDLGDPASLARAAAGATAVLHLAARTHARRPRDYDEANVAGTRRLLDAAREAGVERFVHVSTRAIGAAGGAYSRSKLAAEGVVEGSGLEWTIVRLPEVYGAGSAEGVDDVIARARRGTPIPVVGRGDDLVCPVHVDDAVAALAAALTAPAAAGKVYTLAGDCLTVRDFARACAAAFGTRSRIVDVPLPALRALSLAARVAPLPLYPDQLARLRAPKPPRSPEAAADLGFAPRALADGLR
jgi:nucleoside-diphosphate-sugar epimerase